MNFIKRRRLLVEKIKGQFEIKDGVILLFSGIEDHRFSFRQESNFYYLTGITEPGVALCLYLDGREVIYTPSYERNRGDWVENSSSFDKNMEIKELGSSCSAYWLGPFFNKDNYQNLISDLSVEKNLFSILNRSVDTNFSSIYRFDCISSLLGNKNINDISDIVTKMRRKKSDHEIDLISKASEVTCKAHKLVAQVIKDGLYERDIQAEIVSCFIKNGAREAFPSIVASGKSSTVLHYTSKDGSINNGDSVVVDIGAELDYYCADITRTYFVGNQTSQRQKDIYNAVLEVQGYVEGLAKPGMFLANKQEPERSLHHLAVKFLEGKGLAEYFVHGIGHFMGLDVHDVGDYNQELTEGDVITIEPGIYIPKEGLGVRIEDDFVLTENGCRCLSCKLEK